MNALFLVCASGCSLIEDPEPPVAVGTFAVTGELKSNTCGYSAMPMPTSFEVEGELSGVAGGAATWRWETQGTTVSGSATTSGVYSFSTSRQMAMLAADAFTGYAGCTLIERSEVVFTVTPVPQGTDDGGVEMPMGDADGGVATRTLSGTYTVDIYPASGSDCTPLLGANGGTFQAVPCQAKSELVGTME